VTRELLSEINRLIEPITRRVGNLVARATVSTVDDSKKLQQLQLKVLAGETRDLCERFQQYGFTANPNVGAEAIVIFIGGNRDHPIVLAVDDRASRKLGLQPGEVAIYTDQGDYLHFKRGGNVELKASTKVTVTCPNVELTGTLAVDGDINCSGTVTGTTDVLGGGKHLKTHTHSGVTAGGGTSGPPV
jgi:phage baseplate assembly protein V